MLQHAKLVAFAATTDGSRAAAFYGTVLGLRVGTDDAFALTFDAGGVELRLQKVERFTPQPFTTLGWQVPDIAEVLEQLHEHGVVPERYPWLDQDASGRWLARAALR